METSPAASSPAAAAPMTVVEIDVGNTAKSGRFVITGSGFEAGKRVVISPNPGPYSGKGTMSDESEMDAITVVGAVLDTNSLECFWHAIPGPVRGFFKFQYRLANP